MRVHHERRTLVADGDGSVTASIGPLNGRIVSINYTKAGSGGYSDGVDFACTLAKTGQNVWTEANVNASKACAPRLPTHSQAGVAQIYDTAMPVLDYIRAVDEMLVIAVTNAGAAGTGQFDVIWEQG